MQDKTKLMEIDRSSLRTNLACIILICLFAFAINLYGLVALVAAFLIYGTITRRMGFCFIYDLILRPLRLAKPHMITENPAPHRFTQGLTGTTLTVAVFLINLRINAPGWILTWIVIILASLNLLTGFCLGCKIYDWLKRGKTDPDNAEAGKNSEE